MIYELRTYTLTTGTEAAYLKLFREVGMDVRGNDYGRLEGLWTSDSGTMGQVFHLWSYESLEARDRLKDAVRVEQPRWMSEYVPSIRTMMQSEQDSKLLRLVDGIELTPPPGDRHVYELLTYQCHAAQAPAWARKLKEVLSARQRYSPLVALWLSDTGALNQAYSLWAYDDLNHRTTARAQATADPEWQAFEADTAAIVATRHSVLLAPDEASPLR